MLLDGKSAVITGAGSGVGRASALRFAEEGAKVVVADLQPDWAKETVRQVEAAGGVAVAVDCDVSQDDQVAGMIASAVEQYGRLDILFNNVGISTPRPGLIFENHTVEDNVLAILETRDLDETARQERLEQILAELRIAHVRKSMGMALSGGERRRVEIARALAAEPRFVLLDEPFAGVDPLSVIDIQRIMTELTAMGIGVLITDHNVRETLGVCGRAYIVSGGTVIASGTSEEILANPQVREVYLGQSFRM